MFTAWIHAALITDTAIVTETWLLESAREFKVGKDLWRSSGSSHYRTGPTWSWSLGALPG